VPSSAGRDRGACEIAPLGHITRAILIMPMLIVGGVGWRRDAPAEHHLLAPGEEGGELCLAPGIALHMAAVRAFVGPPLGGSPSGQQGVDHPLDLVERHRPLSHVAPLHIGAHSHPGRAGHRITPHQQARAPGLLAREQVVEFDDQLSALSRGQV